MTEAIQAVPGSKYVGCILVSSALKRCAILHIEWDVKTMQVNKQPCLIQELMLYDTNLVSEIGINIFCVKCVQNWS